MKTTKMAGIIAMGALLGALAGCEYQNPSKGASFVKESDSTSTATESQGSSDTDTLVEKISDLESKIEQEKNTNSAESTTVIEGLQKEIDALKDQLASAKDAAPAVATTPTETPGEGTPGKTPDGSSPSTPGLTQMGPDVAVAVTNKYPTFPKTPSNGVLADLALKAGDPVIVDVNVGDGRKYMAKDKANQELRCSDKESGMVVIGFKVQSAHFGSYLGREEDYYNISKQYGDHYSPMVPGTGTGNIRHLSIICGRLGKDGVSKSNYLETGKVGATKEGDGFDFGYRSFEDSEGAGDEGDRMDFSSWGFGENVPAQPNAVMTGIKLRVFQAQKSQARADTIANGEGEALGYYGYKPADMEDWNSRHTPTDGKVIESLKMYGAKLNPQGDPAKSDTDDALIDSRPESSADSPWLSGKSKGDLSANFSCPAKHVMTGVNVRSNWFYGIVWVDSIECKEIVPLYQK